MSRSETEPFCDRAKSDFPLPQFLGSATWNVNDVTLLVSGKAVEIRLEYISKKMQCPECGNFCSIYDHAPEQKWWHLDTMQFGTILVARIPRCACKECRRQNVQCALGRPPFTLHAYV